MDAPRWAHWAAHAVALATLPSGLWRIWVALGAPSGYTDEGLRELCPPGLWGPAYLIGLSVLTEVAALLTLALVKPWGEARPRLVTRIAWTAVAVLAVLWTPLLFWWAMPLNGMTPTGHFVVGFLYLPLVAWAPLLAAVTLAYQHRLARPRPLAS